MTVRRGLPLPLTLALALGLLSLAACDGASPAGDGFIGQGGTPVVESLAVTALSTPEVDDLSAGLAFGTSATQTRLLAGRVADPSFGDVAATAYIDFLRPALPEAFRGATPTSVSLILPVGAYTYGDPMADVELGIAQITEPWRARLDTVSLEAGQAVATGPAFSSATVPADTSRTLTIPLAASWVTGNDSLLTSTNSAYARRFKGLALIPPAGSGAVREFAATGILLRVVVAGDTLDYAANEVYSRIEATPPPATATMRPVRDGTGRALGLTLALDADSLQNSALSQARLVVRLDTAALQADGLSRPLPTVFSLIGVGADSARVPIANGGVSDGAVSFAGSTVTRLVQDAIFGNPLFVRYDVVFPSSPATVNVAPFSSVDLILVRVPPVE